MKENGAIGEEAEDPGTSWGVDAKRSQRSNHDLRLNVIEEVRKVEKENAADAVCRDTVSRFEAKESGRIGGREEFVGAELSGAQKIVAEIKGTEVSGDNFLK